MILIHLKLMGRNNDFKYNYSIYIVDIYLHIDNVIIQIIHFHLLT